MAPANMGEESAGKEVLLHPKSGIGRKITLTPRRRGRKKELTRPRERLRCKGREEAKSVTGNQKTHKVTQLPRERGPAASNPQVNNDGSPEGSPEERPVRGGPTKNKPRSLR